MMNLVKVTTRGRYALRLMIDLASQEGERYIPLKDISGRQGISRKYLEQIVPLLTAAGFLKTVRGPLGGYRIARPLEEITVGDILRITECSASHIACIDQPGSCERLQGCPTALLWQEVDEMVERYFEGITLADLLERMKQEK